MVWGATAGVVAGAAGGWVATLLHLPTRVLIWWIEVVAGNAGRVPLGELRAPHVVAICVAAVVAAKVRGQHAAAVRALGALAIVIALLQPSVALRSVRLDGASVAEGVTLWRDRHHAVVVVDGRADPVRALDAVRRAGVSRIDLVVARTGAIGVGDVVRALDARYDLGAVWAPAGHAVRGASVPRPGVAVRAGPFVATVDSIDPRLVVHVRRA
jgi:hypothetical protein